MNEIVSSKDLEALTVELEPLEVNSSCPPPSWDHEPSAPGSVMQAFLHDQRISDRRVAQRYLATQGKCWIGWHEAGTFRNSAAWIIDISSSGALVATDASAPR